MFRSEDVKTIMLTIRKRHLNHMRQGVKGWELRKTRPRIKPPFRVLCCVSGTAGSVEAAWICDSVVSLNGADVNHVARIACVTPEEVRAYRREGDLYGWHIQDGTFRDWKAEGIPKHITDFSIRRPPQSWCYAEETGERA